MIRKNLKIRLDKNYNINTISPDSNQGNCTCAIGNL